MQAIDPNLGDYTQWVRLRAPTGRKFSRMEEITKKKKQSKVLKAYRMVAVDLLKVLGHGHGEIPQMIVR